VRHDEVELWGATGAWGGKNAVSTEKKKTKAQLRRAKKTSRGSKWGLAPLVFRLSFSPALLLFGAVKNAPTKQLSPELGDAVSRVVEKLSRKIHNQTTKSYAVSVESVYL
jgi:hypothetical protein